MADERISSFVTDEGRAEVKAVTEELRALTNEIINANNVAKNAEGFTRQAKSVEDLAKSTSSLVDANGKMVASVGQLDKKWHESITLINQLNGHSKEAVQVKQELVKLSILEQRAATASAKAAGDQGSAYKALNAEYRKAANAAKELAAIHGVESEQARKAAAEVLKLSDNLKKIDASVGQNQRNVGNYSGALTGLGFSVRNIASELPNLGISIRTFSQSISNNIGPLSDAIRQLREENKILAAQGQATTPIWKTVAGSFFTVQTAILLAVAAGTFLVDKLAKGNKAAQDAEKANKKYAESLKSIEENQRESANEEIAHAKVLTSLAADTEQTMKTRLRAVKELQETYPTTFGNLEKEAILEGRVADALKETTNQLFAKAAALAASEKFAASEKKAYDLQLAQEDATERLNKALAKSAELSALVLANPANERLAKSAVIASREVQKLQKELLKYNDALSTASLESGRFLNDSQRAAAQAGDLFTQDGKATPKGKTPTDLTKENLTADIELTKERIKTQKLLAEQTAKAQKAIAEDEKRTLDERLEAYNQYILARLDAAGFGAQAELDSVRIQLKKIAELEAKPGKRTKEEQDVIRQKELLNQRLINLQIEYNTLIADIQEEGFGLQDKLQDNADKDAIAATKDRYKKAVELARKGIKDINDATDDEKDKQKKKEAEREKLIGSGIDFAQNLSGLESTFAQRRIQELDSEIRKINEKRDAEIDAINLAGGTEEERAKKIAAANIKAAAEEKRLEQEKVTRQRRAAAFEKAVTIGQIIAQTALAVVKALPNYILAAVVAASGAVALARAIATPLPQYEHGTQGKPHKGGPAVLFEGNKTEAVIENGRIWTGNKEGIYNLARGAEVISNKELMMLSHKATLLPMLMSTGNAALDTSRIEAGLEAVKRAVESKPTPSTSITGGGITHVVMTGQHMIKYELNLKH